MAEVDGTAGNFSSGNIAAAWWLGGCSVVPIRPITDAPGDGGKKPRIKWERYQRILPTEYDIREWFEELFPRDGVAVICGKVSGNLEMLELEGRAGTPESQARISETIAAQGLTELWNQLLNGGYSEVTPSGGIHLIYRISDHPVPGNTKIARRLALPEELTPDEVERLQQNPNWKPIRVLCETRGEGGYTVVAPTPGTCHKTGRPWAPRTGHPGFFLTVTWAEREAIRLALHAALDEMPPEPEREPSSEMVPRNPDILTPGDDWNLRASWEDRWFTEAGWRIHHRSGNEIFWTRPGKDLADGPSATTGYADDGDRLFVWSTSVDLPTEQPLSKFFVYAHYHFGGDLKKCAAALRVQGFGAAILQHSDFGEWEALGEQGNAEVDGPVPSHSLRSREQQAMPDGGILFTDLGYARRLYDMYRSTMRYNSTEKQWYIWHPGGTHWEADEGHYIDQCVENHANDVLEFMQRNYQQAIAAGAEKEEKTVQRTLYLKAQHACASPRLSAIASRVKTQPGMTVTADQFDPNIDLLNVQNGIYHLKTKELQPHDPAQMQTRVFGAAYDPEAECPRFMKFIREVLPDDETQRYVQRALGYSLLGRPDERVLFLLHGPSGTGKSVLTEVMTKLWGSYGTTAPASTFRQKRNETTVDVHELRGRRIVTTSELPEGAQLDEDLVKRLTGGDGVMSRALYESYHRWNATCVIWIATNFLPRLSGDDNAIWRRAKTIPMRVEFGPDAHREIKGLADLLLQERDGIFNWVLEGLDSFRANGLADPPAVKTDIETYRNEIDTVAAWLKESEEEGVFVRDPEGRIPTAVLYQSYVTSCNEAGTQPLGRRRFTNRLSNKVKGLESKKIGGNMVYCGIRHAGDKPGQGGLFS